MVHMKFQPWKSSLLLIFYKRTTTSFISFSKYFHTWIFIVSPGIFCLSICFKSDAFLISVLLIERIISPHFNQAFSAIDPLRIPLFGSIKSHCLKLLSVVPFVDSFNSI